MVDSPLLREIRRGSMSPDNLNRNFRDLRDFAEQATSGLAAVAGKTQLIIPFHANASALLVWGNMPAANDFLIGDDHCVTKIDLTAFAQCRLIVNKQQTAGAAGAVLRLRYVAAYTPVVGSYLMIGTREVQVAIDVANKILDSDWINLVDGAKGDVFVCVDGVGGDGVADPDFGSIFAHFR